MKTFIILLVFSVFMLNNFFGSNACGGGGGGSGGGGSSGGNRARSSGRSSRGKSYYTSTQTNRGKKVSAFGKTAYIGKTGLRDRDKTGHRTGLGTILRNAVKNPKATWGAAKAFYKSWSEMRKANVKGGNIKAHEEANRKATQIAGPKVASAISALREQYKNVRARKNPDGSYHIGDTRNPKERKDTMDANHRGRQQALKGGR